MTLKEQLEKYKITMFENSFAPNEKYAGFDAAVELLLPLVDECVELTSDPFAYGNPEKVEKALQELREKLK